MPIPVASTVAASRASTTRLMVPTDVNFAGNVFGGHVLEEIDRVAYITATRHSQADCVTASFDRVDFLSPIHVGDVVDFEAELTYVGTSSMEVWVRVRAESTHGGDPRPVGELLVPPEGRKLVCPVGCQGKVGGCGGLGFGHRHCYRIDSI